jgi:hypothetical protein
MRSVYRAHQVPGPTFGWLGGTQTRLLLSMWAFGLLVPAFGVVATTLTDGIGELRAIATDISTGLGSANSAISAVIGFAVAQHVHSQSTAVAAKLDATDDDQEASRFSRPWTITR